VPSYRVLLTVGSLRPGVRPDGLLPSAAASAATLTTVEASDIMMMRGEPQLVVRFTGADDQTVRGRRARRPARRPRHPPRRRCLDAGRRGLSDGAV
jgi:hypothetical protein